MRDNARRLLHDTGPSSWPCGWCWASGRCPSATEVIFSLCILAGGRRGALASASPGSQPSAIRKSSCRPRIFRGRWFWSAGIPTVCFRAFGARRNPSRLVSPGGDSAEQLPRLAQYLAAAVRRWYRRFPCCWRWYRSTTLRGASGAVAARLAAEYRSGAELGQTVCRRCGACSG